MAQLLLSRILEPVLLPKRWHWVAYPYKLGLGVKPDYRGESHSNGTTELVAEAFDGERPDWSEITTYTIPLIFPGTLDWTDLTSDSHAMCEEIRNSEITIWELYEKDPESFFE